ncbi:MAG: YceH family protein [Kiritimatiellae bacterium]|nr:YceH family protein [Kiritimatiellia bacterium]
MNSLLTDVEVRVLGCLIEKSMTTPEYYPLTLHALTAACNQKSNRAPVMALDEETVTKALNELRYTHHLACQVSVAGSRVPKFSHDAVNKLPLTDLDLVLMCELMLRGPQTAGELRTHAKRLREIESVSAVADAMSSLAAVEPDPMVVRLPPGPGHREPRYAHLLSGEVDVPPPSAHPIPAVSASNDQSPPRDERLATLEEKVDLLQSEVQALRETLNTFRSQFE